MCPVQNSINMWEVCKQCKDEKKQYLRMINVFIVNWGHEDNEQNKKTRGQINLREKIKIWEEKDLIKLLDLSKKHKEKYIKILNLYKITRFV